MITTSITTTTTTTTTTREKDGVGNIMVATSTKNI